MCVFLNVTGRKLYVDTEVLEKGAMAMVTLKIPERKIITLIWTDLKGITTMLMTGIAYENILLKQDTGCGAEFSQWVLVLLGYGDAITLAFVHWREGERQKVCISRPPRLSFFIRRWSNSNLVPSGCLVSLFGLQCVSFSVPLMKITFVLYYIIKMNSFSELT